MKVKLPESVTRALRKTGMKAIKHSPELLMVGAIIGVAGAMIEVGRATMKLNDVAEPHKEKIAEIHESQEEIIESDETEVAVVNNSELKKQLAKEYMLYAFDVSKLYASSIIIGSLSIACILSSHKMLKSRNLALAAAYEAADKAFKSYRNRVVERFGKEVEEEIRYNIKTQEVEETVTDANGKTKTKKVKKSVVEPGLESYSEYAKFFDEASDQWEDDAEYNYSFLVRAQEEFNRRLRANGMVFLNEVYEYLGIPLTRAGQIVGWVYDSEDEYADNHIDFGIHIINRMVNRDFINGYEKVILLDFNVQGNILQLMN